MAGTSRFDRNIRPTAASDDEESFHTASDVSNEPGSDSANELSSGDDALSDAEEEEEDATEQLHAVSFGALKKASEALSRKRKANDDDGPDREAKLESLRKRLQSIRAAKSKSKPQSESRQRTTTQQFEIKQSADDDESSDETTGPEEQPTRTRVKHAPAAQSTKHQVSRKRQVIELPKDTTRDPRFDAAARSRTNPEHTEKAYAFLRDYEKTEMQELKTAIKQTKSQDDKETLRRKLNSMENRLKARTAKEREQGIIRKHRKQESDQVREGKTPYFLKRSEIKQRALVEKFEAMKGKDREKLMERRRKKDSQKEKRRMPEFRRVAST